MLSHCLYPRLIWSRLMLLPAYCHRIDQVLAGNILRYVHIFVYYRCSYYQIYSHFIFMVFNLRLNWFLNFIYLLTSANGNKLLTAIFVNVPRLLYINSNGLKIWNVTLPSHVDDEIWGQKIWQINKGKLAAFFFTNLTYVYLKI